MVENKDYKRTMDSQGGEPSTKTDSKDDNKGNNKGSDKGSGNDNELLENILAILLAGLVILGMVALINGWISFDTSPKNLGSDGRYRVSTGHYPVLGDNGAPVVIVEFSNYGCIHCKEFSQKVLPEIEKEYIDKGLVRFYYRDFANFEVPNGALVGAKGAFCADEQGKFWDFNKKLYSLSFVDDVSVRKSAEELGLNMTLFNKCLSSRRPIDSVRADYIDAKSLGVAGTPTFFINGKKVVGNKDFSEFKKLIDDELERTNNKE